MFVQAPNWLGLDAGTIGGASRSVRWARWSTQTLMGYWSVEQMGWVL